MNVSALFVSYFLDCWCKELELGEPSNSRYRIEYSLFYLATKQYVYNMNIVNVSKFFLYIISCQIVHQRAVSGTTC